MDWILNMAEWFGSAVCHQIPSHGYHVDGHALPLCARCTGMYFGALVTLAFHARLHPRAIGLPRPWVLITLVLFIFAWAGDGLNSFLSTFSALPHLYSPENILRLITGALMGITIGTFIYVVFNSLFWAAPLPDPILASPREFLALLGLNGLLVLMVQSEWAPLLYLLNGVTILAILSLHTTLMSALIVSLRRAAPTLQTARVSAALGLFVALSYLSAIALMRMALGLKFDLPT